MTVPYRYQIEDARRVHRFNYRSLIVWEMGLGKTFLSLLCMQRHPEILPAVVVCPASLKFTWEREAAHHIGMRAEVLETTRPPRKGLWQPSKLTIINYDILEPWLPRLKALNPKLIVIDEAHYLANRGTKRTGCIHALCQGVPHILALTGTPLVNRPAELFSTLNLLWPREFPSFYPFGNHFCGPQQKPWGREYKGATHLDELHGRLLNLGMVRRRKADVLSQLPPKRHTIVPVEMIDHKQYAKAETDFIGWLAEQDLGKARRAASAEKMTQLGYLKRLAGELKLQAIFQWVDDWLKDTDSKLVLFGIHKKILGPIYERYKKLAVLVDGSVTGIKRQQAVDKFQHHAKTRLFVGNVRAAGVGLTLTASSTVLFVELDWVPGVMAQAADRCHRIGTVNAVDIIWLIARNSIEEKLCRIIQSKQKTITKVLDGKKAKQDEMNVYDLLTNEYLKQRTGEKSCHRRLAK